MTADKLEPLCLVFSSVKWGACAPLWRGAFVEDQVVCPSAGVRSSSPAMLTPKAAVRSSMKRSSSFEAASKGHPASPLPRRAQRTWQASSCPAHGAWGFRAVSAALPLLTRGQSSGPHDLGGQRNLSCLGLHVGRGHLPLQHQAQLRAALGVRLCLLSNVSHMVPVVRKIPGREKAGTHGPLSSK